MGSSNAKKNESLFPLKEKMRNRKEGIEMSGRGRRNGNRLVWVIAAALVLVCLAGAALADVQDDARGMLQMINDFRTGDDAWYWNKDNTTYTMATGLGKLQYDYELEEVAKVRAEELSRSFSHTRPDGSKWSTAFPKGNYYKGENLAYGYETAADAFAGLQETDEDYSGQGHRRNMLRKEFTRVGFAAVNINGTNYWVQEFASGKVQKASPDAAETGWIEDGGKYYYRNDDGSWATGWIEDGNKWYHLDKNGAMETGWIEDGGNWYYANRKGMMQTGWIETGGNWYYFQKDGVMATGRCSVDGHVEVFGKDGVWQAGEIEDYDTPLGTGSPLMRFIQAMMQMIMNAFRAK